MPGGSFPERTVATVFSGRGAYTAGMSDADADPDVTELLADLTRSLRELQSEMEPERRLRPPSPGELSQFASEVAIPGLILLLQTNIRALQLLQRTIRLAQGRDPRGGGSAGSDVRERAEELSRATLGQLDNTLSEIQDAVEGRPADDDTRQLLSEARDLRDEIRAELDDGSGNGDSPAGDDGGTAGDTGGAAAGDSDPVDIDVEAELRTIKDNLEDDEDGEGEGESDDAADHGEPTGDGTGSAEDSTGDDGGESTGPDDAAGTDGAPDSGDDG